MGALSEGLAKDKVELNRLLLQVSVMELDSVHSVTHYVYLVFLQPTID